MKNLLSSKGNIFYCFFICSFIFHNGEKWKEPTLVFIDIFFILLFLFYKKIRVFTILLFLLYGMSIKITNYPDLANHSNLFLFLCFFLFCQLLLKIKIYKKDKILEPLKSNLQFWKTLNWILILTYFFAGLHKFNINFIYDSYNSCAFWYLEKIIFPIYPDFQLDKLFLKSFVPIFVLILEFGACFFLIFRKTQYFGLILAVSLHALLSIGGFVDFASLAFCLMLSFLPEKLFNEKKSEQIIKIYALLSIYYAIFTKALIFLGAERAVVFYLQGLMFIPLVGLVIYLIFSKLKKSQLITPKEKFTIGKLGWVFLIFLCFFGSQNYLGLSTAGTFSMFSNLSTETKNSNHLIFRNNPLRVFPFQEDLVWVKEVQPVELDYFRKGWNFTGYGIPLIEFKRSLTKKRKEPEYHKVGMDFVYKGKTYSIENIVLNETWSPKKLDWKMRFFQFRRVFPPDTPVYCQW